MPTPVALRITERDVWDTFASSAARSLIQRGFGIPIVADMAAEMADALIEQRRLRTDVQPVPINERDLLNEAAESHDSFDARRGISPA